MKAFDLAPFRRADARAQLVVRRRRQRAADWMRKYQTFIRAADASPPHCPVRRRAEQLAEVAYLRWAACHGLAAGDLHEAKAYRARAAKLGRMMKVGAA